MQHTKQNFNSTNSWVNHEDKDQAITFCGFLETNWTNRPDIIQISLTGAAKASKTIVGKDYFSGSGCVYLFPKQFAKGMIEFTVSAKNEFGANTLHGSFEVTVPYKYTEPSNTPDSGSGDTQSLPDPWSRTYRNRITEEVAKTTWCIKNGYRNYNYSKDICTNTLNR